MLSVNVVVIQGHLGRDPELRRTAQGVPVLTLSVATSEGKRGENETTEWHRVVAWGSLAETLGRARKGDAVHLSGRLQTRSYEKDGQKRHITEIKALAGQLYPKREDAPARVQQDDDIPF